MNKIKLLYDVVMTMKDKEAFKGKLKAEGIKDNVKKFSFNNEFEKDISTGQTKAKINTEVDCDGNRVKHESSTEFYSKDGCKHMHRHIMSHMHSCHGKCGIKEKLTGIAFILSMFNNIKVEEKEDKSYNMVLKLSDIPEEMKKAICEKMKQKHEGMCCDNKHFEAMKDFHCMCDHEVEITAVINKNYELETLSLAAEGTKTDVDNVKHGMSINAELNLVW